MTEKAHTSRHPDLLAAELVYFYRCVGRVVDGRTINPPGHVLVACQGKGTNEEWLYDFTDLTAAQDAYPNGVLVSGDTRICSVCQNLILNPPQ